jgi:1-acyl-sn-glycerol-3-phosphate acyltransferase
LSNNGATEETSSRNNSRAYPRAFPEPVLTILRPCARATSRLLWQVSWKGTENIPPNGGLIIAANHQTYIDPFWVGAVLKRPLRFLAWDEAFGWPIVGKAMRWLGAWPLQLEKSDPTAIKRSLQWLRDGGAVVMFPEGGRGNPDGSLRRFKPGAVRIALESGVPILPVTIRGGERVWANTMRVPRVRRHVEVIYHPLIKVEQLENEDVRECARRESERLSEIVASAL